MGLFKIINQIFKSSKLFRFANDAIGLRIIINNITE